MLRQKSSFFYFVFQEKLSIELNLSLDKSIAAQVHSSTSVIFDFFFENKDFFRKSVKSFEFDDSIT